MNTNMQDGENQAIDAAATQAALDSQTTLGKSRRRLFKASLGAAPVVMTLASRPVLAWHCTTPSAFGSINVSHKQVCTTKEFSTCTASEWDVMCQGGSSGGRSWPSGCGSKTTLKMSDCFPGSGSSSLVKNVLNKSTGTSFDRILVTAYLNCKAGYVDPVVCLTVAGVQSMYSKGKLGTYKPSTGSKVWTQADILNYLNQNWIAVDTTWSGSWNCHS